MYLRHLFELVLSLKPSQGTGSLLDLRVLTKEGRACMVFSYCAIIHFNNKYLFLPVHIFCHLARIFVGGTFHNNGNPASCSL